MATRRHRTRVDEVKDTLVKIQKNLQCPICLELLSDPYTTRCSHAFCRVCICTVISTSKRARCPLCNATITKRSLNESSRLGEIVEAVKALEIAIKMDTKEEITFPPLAPSLSQSSHDTVCGTQTIRHPNTLVLHQVCGDVSDEKNNAASLEQPTVCANPILKPLLVDTIPCKKIRVTPARNSKRNSRPNKNQRWSSGSTANSEWLGEQRHNDGEYGAEVPAELAVAQTAGVTSSDTAARTTDGAQRSDVAPATGSNSLGVIGAPGSNSLGVIGAPGTLPPVTVIHETPFITAEGNSLDMADSTVKMNVHSEEPIWIQDNSDAPVSLHPVPIDRSGEVKVGRGDLCGKIQPGDQMCGNEKVLSGDQAHINDKEQSGDQVLLSEALCGDQVFPQAQSLPSKNESSPIIPLQNHHTVCTANPPVRWLSFELVQANPPMTPAPQEPITVVPQSQAPSESVVHSSQPSPSNKSILTRLPGLFTVASGCTEDKPTTRQGAVKSQDISCTISSENLTEERPVVELNQKRSTSVSLLQETPAEERTKAMTASVNVVAPVLPTSCDMSCAAHDLAAPILPISCDTSYAASDAVAPVVPNSCDMSCAAHDVVAPVLPNSCDLSGAAHDTHPGSVTVVPDSFLQRDSAAQCASFASTDSTAQPTQLNDPASDEFTSQDIQILQKKMQEKQKEIEELEALLACTTGAEHVSSRPEDVCAPTSAAGDTPKPENNNNQSLSSRANQNVTQGPLCTPSKQGSLVDWSLVTKADNILKALRRPIDHSSGENEQTPSKRLSDHTSPKSHISFPSPSSAMCTGRTPRLHPQAQETIQTPLVCQKTICTPSYAKNSAQQSSFEMHVPSGVGRKVVLDVDDVETESPPEEIPLLPDDHPFLTVSTSKGTLPQSLPPSSNTSVLATRDSSKDLGGTLSDRFSPDSQKLPPPRSVPILSSGQIDTPIVPLQSIKRTPLAMKRESNTDGVQKCKNIKLSDSHLLSLVGSGLTRAQLQQARVFAKKQGGRIAECYNGSTTHVIVNADENCRCLRTLKYLQGIASGRWIVDYRWIKDSMEKQNILPEATYEVRGDHLYCVNAPQTARLSLARGGSRLFSGMTFFVMDGCSPLPKDQISKLLQLAGGKIVSNPKSCLVICDTVPTSNGLFDSTCILSSWVTDSLSHYKLLSVRDYLAKKL